MKTVDNSDSAKYQAAMGVLVTAIKNCVIDISTAENKQAYVNLNNVIREIESSDIGIHIKNIPLIPDEVEINDEEYD